ncbi:hypothetical protein AVEN_97725-1 [Araneus ventricosus]|uniref:DUF5641 domain-containing protein n=1 Tax=Araneus ventricosus TaxID=182803 RepID=A0A4Y2ME07_ARAVE|nr:hypothetical protein AVEN_93916-1 [Araneus ventricosus]GBN24879.1 hypothetical protein AVEN_265150-1 [Araneus ventricosus]GBN41256.1 hypothetical protein AVEN_116979-1 [Araneus ventricosus]GBN41266.1 hypothetical protein AVEN_97725-1 [Araneus ventricosus]
MCKRCRWAARQSCPVVRWKAATASRSRFASDGNRINWPLGIVIEVLHGADGHSRVAKVRTADGEKLRPFQKLYSLEISSSEKLPFISQQKDESTKPLRPASPYDSDQDSSEDDDSSTKVVPDVVNRAG